MEPARLRAARPRPSPRQIIAGAQERRLEPVAPGTRVLSPDALLRVQRDAGNAAAVELIQRQTPALGVEPAGAPPQRRTLRFASEVTGADPATGLVFSKASGTMPGRSA